MTELVVGEAFVNLELHGIDFLSAEDGLEMLLGYQPDVRIRAAEKRAVLSSVLGRLRKAGYRFVPLGEVADTHDGAQQEESASTGRPLRAHSP